MNCIKYMNRIKQKNRIKQINRVEEKNRVKEKNHVEEIIMKRKEISLCNVNKTIDLTKNEKHTILHFLRKKTYI